MTALGQILAGGRVPASMLRAVAPLSAMKGDDQPLSAHTAMQDDDDLMIPLLANAGYFVVCLINYISPGAADFQYTFTAPGGITGWQQPIRLNLSGELAGAFSANWTDTITASGEGESTVVGVCTFGNLVTGPTPGNLQLQWAQYASNGSDTTVKAGSLLAAWQLQ